jgi:hypothetical protein
VARIPPDPHAAADGCYSIRSLYLDTDAFDVYHRTPGFSRSKYRLRRYGDESLVYLERKTRANGWVTKQRTAVPEAELALLAYADPDGWAGGWFRERIRERRLAPRCEIGYRRLARVGEAEGAPIRLTVDRQIRCAPAAALAFGAHDGPGAVLSERTILEIKFQHALPQLFKSLLREFSLVPSRSSKYRRAVELCGLARPSQRT